MSKQPCQAKNKATCRVHGVGLREAKTVITQTIGANRLSSSDALKAVSMLKNAENYDAAKTATGMVVHYNDGSSEVFIGSATDPYHATDWSFNSSNGTLVEVAYDGDDTRDPVETGSRTVENYQQYLEHALIDAKPVYQEGEDTFTSNKVVSKVTVL
jgi:hypothetical protein